MKRGDVFWATLAPRSGSEQQGRRPVVVMMHNSFNDAPHWQSVIVIPISTSERQSGRGPTIVPLPAGAGGIPRARNAICHQITTLDRSKLSQQIGALSLRELEAIEEGIRAALDMP